MKAITIVKYVFGLIGAALLAGAFFMYRSTSDFLAEAIKTEGTVVDLALSRSSNSTTYSPIVQFTSRDGQAIEFISSFSSNPPSYRKGEKVEVLYLPVNPQDAKISGFFSLWGGVSIVGGLGAVFFAIGTGIMLAGRLKERKNDYLLKHGAPIETQFQSVSVNTAFSDNGRNPFVILTQWQNPATSEIHVFRSDNIWFDPSNYVAGKKITVYIEQGNPKNYHVDLSFLPRFAE